MATLPDQETVVNTNPNITKGSLVLSSPGIIKGITIEAAVNWPTAIPISANVLSCESVNKDLVFVKFNCIWD